MLLSTSGDVASTSLGFPETRKVMSTLTAPPQSPGADGPRPCPAYSRQRAPSMATLEVVQTASAPTGLEEAAEDLAHRGATELTGGRGGEHLFDHGLVLGR